MKYIQGVLLSFLISYSVVGQEWNTTGNNTTTGDVGINVTQPLADLDVRGDISGYRVGWAPWDNFAFGTRSDFNVMHYGISLFYEQVGSLETAPKTALSGYYGLKFFTAGKERINITNTGNVGIGITNPASKLHLNGDLKMNIGEGLRVYGNSNYFGTNLDGVIFEIQDTNGANSAVDGGFVFRGLTTTDNVHKDLMVLKGAGNVGIGTINPASKLHLNGDLKMNIGEGLRVYGNSNYFGTNLDGVIFEIQDTNGANSAVDGGFVFRGLTTKDNVHKDLMVLKGAGNVGIGTTDPKNKLSVNGTVWAKEVKVTLTDAADWVFEEDYELRPLSEVAHFIQENKHLPEIPSAEEFRKNDLKVSEMTNKLLQKIEELTLYTIAQEKQLVAQSTQLQVQKKKLAEMETLKLRMATLEALIKNQEN